MKRLRAAEVDRRLRALPGWHREGRQLRCVFEFRDFPRAIRWVNRVARLAEVAGHHPDLLIEYNRVTVTLTTHDAGGLTSKDLALAAELAGLPTA